MLSPKDGGKRENKRIGSEWESNRNGFYSIHDAHTEQCMYAASQDATIDVEVSSDRVMQEEVDNTSRFFVGFGFSNECPSFARPGTVIRFWRTLQACGTRQMCKLVQVTSLVMAGGSRPNEYAVAISFSEEIACSFVAAITPHSSFIFTEMDTREEMSDTVHRFASTYQFISGELENELRCVHASVQKFRDRAWGASVTSLAYNLADAKKDPSGRGETMQQRISAYADALASVDGLGSLAEEKQAGTLVPSIVQAKEHDIASAHSLFYKGFEGVLCMNPTAASDFVGMFPSFMGVQCGLSVRRSSVSTTRM
jgi:hypothetical protein